MLNNGVGSLLPTRVQSLEPMWKERPIPASSLTSKHSGCVDIYAGTCTHTHTGKKLKVRFKKNKGEYPLDPHQARER